MKNIVILLIICILSSHNIDIHNTFIKLTPQQTKILSEAYSPMEDKLLKEIQYLSDKDYNKFIECLSRVPEFSAGVLDQFHLAKKINEAPEDTLLYILEYNKFRISYTPYNLEELLLILIKNAENRISAINNCIEENR